VADARPLLVCLLGPTAAGKTDLAIELARARDCELVSVDSALVYRGLEIGAARPDYPHHLVGIRDPSEVYSAADFVADADRLAGEITARGHIPLLVGGTMLYFRAFLEGLSDMPPADPVLRAEIEAEAAAHGWPRLHAALAQVDPEAAARIHPNHSQRLVRALEVYRVSGTPISRWQRRAGARSLPREHYRVVQIAIRPAERAELHRRIARRFEAMLAAGLLGEVEALWRRGDLGPELPAVRAVGYRQLWQHLAGECTLDEAVMRAIAATRQLAKRQLTWLRRWPDLNWLLIDPQGNPVAGIGSEPVEWGNGTKALDLALNFIEQCPM